MASVSQSEQLASTLEPPLPEEKEHSRLSKAPDREVGKSPGEREPHLGE